MLDDIKVENDVIVDVYEGEEKVDSFNLKDLLNTIIEFIKKILTFEFDF